jgi:hypothetical protein
VLSSSNTWVMGVAFKLVGITRLVDNQVCPFDFSSLGDNLNVADLHFGSTEPIILISLFCYCF